MKTINRHGQSIIEYALIAVLVILGVVLMGPYVLRSINAHFKLWDEGVQDSYYENIQQAPVGDIPDIPLNCTCTPQSTGCGSNAAGAQCGLTQRTWVSNCIPQGCNGAQTSYCVDDPTCCATTGVVNIGCGSFPLPTDASGTIDLSLETTNQSPPQPPAAANCYFNQMIQGQQCGSNTAIQCVPTGEGTCSPQCLGTLPANMSPCPNSPGTPGGLALNQNYTVATVANQSACTGLPCQYYDNTVVPPAAYTATVYIDNYVSLYPSDARGDLLSTAPVYYGGSDIYSPPALPNEIVGDGGAVSPGNSPSSTFTVTPDATGNIYFLAVITNAGGPEGISLQINANSQGVCFTQAFPAITQTYNTISPSTYLYNASTVASAGGTYPNLASTPSLSSNICSTSNLTCKPLILDNTPYNSAVTSSLGWLTTPCWINFNESTAPGIIDVHAILLHAKVSS